MVFLLMIKDKKTEIKKNSDHLWEEREYQEYFTKFQTKSCWVQGATDILSC